MKIDAGPPKLGEEQKKRSSLKFGLIFCPKLGDDQKKRKKRSSVKLRRSHFLGPYFFAQNPIVGAGLNMPLDATPKLNAAT